MSEKLINDDGITSLVNRIAAKVANKYATKAIATQSANGLMSAADKAKLDGIATGATNITIDNALSSTSTNPVQNKIVNSALAGKAASSHTHTKSQITDFPSSLPANGGNADTLDGMHAWTHAVLNSDGYFDANDYICFTDNTYGDGRYNVWTPSGKGVRVDYAADADKLDGLHASNFVNYMGRNFDQVNDPAYRVPYECIINSSDVKNTGLPDAKYWHIKYFMHSDSNGYGCQLAFPLNGSDYRPRYRTSFEMTWDEWKEISTTPIKSTNVSGTTNENGDIYLWNINDGKIPISACGSPDTVFSPFLNGDSSIYMLHAINTYTDSPVVNTSVNATVYYF